MSRYLRDDSVHKATHANDLSNAGALRWPIWDEPHRRWLRLEETALEDVPAVLARWTADLRAVRRRCYLGHRTFHLRARPDGTAAWVEQPDPADGERPEPRREVADPALREHLARARGRGPFSTATLRQRQLLVSRILTLAWKHWHTPADPWLDENVAGRIQLAAKPLPREEVLENYDQLLALVIAAPEGFDAAILAATWTGWRKENLLGLEWPRVVFPIVEETDAGARQIQDGYLFVPRADTKTRAKAIVYPMVPHLEQLLRILWAGRCGRYVFHRGDGTPWLDNLKRPWAATKLRAGISPTFTWHGLRHTWTTWMLRNGAPEKQIIELAGWRSGAMLETYAHLRARHLTHTAGLSLAPGERRTS